MYCCHKKTGTKPNPNLLLEPTVAIAELEPGHDHRVTGSVFSPGSGRVSGQTYCVFRPGAVTRFLVEQQTDSFDSS